MFSQLILDCLKSGVCPNWQCKSYECIVNHRSFYGDSVTFDGFNNPTNIDHIYDIVVVTAEGCWLIYRLECGKIQKSRLYKKSSAYINLQLNFGLKRLYKYSDDFLCKYIVCDNCLKSKNYHFYKLVLRNKKSTLFCDNIPSWRNFKMCKCFVQNKCLKKMYTFNNKYCIDVCFNTRCHCSDCNYIIEHNKPKPLYLLSLHAVKRYKLNSHYIFKKYLLPNH
ncbi:unknown [Choristoneura occidentalis granulovirus]|uniref:Uncharacterized protein n=1 Tax=Choristoneura occidentalis granulovirus TaxID=364745 RepID=Q1A4K9_9BBAC|nr:unknown [Choristoneura fumiferana granulovirus]ABC61221.1 unknown [Choristoneura fumiferana granulovirus]